MPQPMPGMSVMNIVWLASPSVFSAFQHPIVVKVIDIKTGRLQSRNFIAGNNPIDNLPKRVVNA